MCCFQGKGDVMTYWLVDADEMRKRRISEHEESMKCHNAMIGSQFSVSRLAHSPSFRRKVLSRTGRVLPCSVESSPTFLKRPFICRKNVRDKLGGSQSSTSCSIENSHMLAIDDISIKRQSLFIDISKEHANRNSCIL